MGGAAGAGRPKDDGEYLRALTGRPLEMPISGATGPDGVRLHSGGARAQRAPVGASQATAQGGAFAPWDLQATA
eukprot:8381327-Alexandrium_andersonii.AAC.1